MPFRASLASLLLRLCWLLPLLSCGRAALGVPAPSPARAQHLAANHRPAPMWSPAAGLLHQEAALAAPTVAPAGLPVAAAPALLPALPAGSLAGPWLLAAAWAAGRPVCPPGCRAARQLLVALSPNAP